MFRSFYRVFNKEGHEVLGYSAMKKYVFEATKRLIASKNMGHLDIFVFCLNICNINVVEYQSKLMENPST